MGRYIDWKDVTDRYKAIGDDLDATKINSTFINYAETKVDGRLAAKFTTPFSNNNITVKDLCIDLVYIKAGNLSIEETEKLNNQVEKTLNDLMSGDQAMILDDGTATFASVSGTIWSTTQNYHPTFGIGSIEYFEIDSSRIIDEEDARL